MTWLNSVNIDTGNETKVTVDFLAAESGILGLVCVSHNRVTALALVSE